MAKIENNDLTVVLPNVDGSTLRNYQDALLLGIEKIGSSDCGDTDHKKSVYFLAEILRAIMLDESQTNIGIGGKAYK